MHITGVSRKWRSYLIATKYLHYGRFVKLFTRKILTIIFSYYIVILGMIKKNYALMMKNTLKEKACIRY